MASQDKSYRAGEAKGQSEGDKTNQMLENLKEKAREAKEKTYETLQSAKEMDTEKARETKEKTYGTTQSTKNRESK